MTHNCRPKKRLCKGTLINYDKDKDQYDRNVFLLGLETAASAGHLLTPKVKIHVNCSTQLICIGMFTKDIAGHSATMLHDSGHRALAQPVGKQLVIFS